MHTSIRCYVISFFSHVARGHHFTLLHQPCTPFKISWISHCLSVINVKSKMTTPIQISSPDPIPKGLDDSWLFSCFCKLSNLVPIRLQLFNFHVILYPLCHTRSAELTNQNVALRCCILLYSNRTMKSVKLMSTEPSPHGDREHYPHPSPVNTVNNHRPTWYLSLNRCEQVCLMS